MSITLSDGTNTVELDHDLFWSDEHNWHPVEQTMQYTLTGAAIVQVAQRQAGRPITLEPEDDSSAWMTRGEVAILRNWAAVAGKEMTLTLRGAARPVLFRHQDGGLDARPVQHFRDGDQADSDWYRCTIRLMEI